MHDISEGCSWIQTSNLQHKLLDPIYPHISLYTCSCQRHTTWSRWTIAMPTSTWWFGRRRWWLQGLGWSLIWICTCGTQFVSLFHNSQCPSPPTIYCDSCQHSGFKWGGQQRLWQSTSNKESTRWGSEVSSHSDMAQRSCSPRRHFRFNLQEVFVICDSILCL